MIQKYDGAMEISIPQVGIKQVILYLCLSNGHWHALTDNLDGKLITGQLNDPLAKHGLNTIKTGMLTGISFSYTNKPSYCKRRNRPKQFTETQLI